MARRSKFTQEQRQEAIQEAFDGNSTPTQVADALGISVPTLYRWAQASRPTKPAVDDVIARRLTEAAQQLLSESTYPDITFEAVARHAEVPLRTAFARYPSKRALFGAAVDQAAEAIVNDMTERAKTLDWPADPLARLRLFLVVNSIATYDHPESHVLFRDLGVPTEDRFAERWHDAYREALTSLLQGAAAAGTLRADLDPDVAGLILARAVRGLHIAVFDGAPREVALEMIERLPLLVMRSPESAT